MVFSFRSLPSLKLVPSLTSYTRAFSIEDVEEAIGDLKENSSPGPDGVPAVLLKKCCKEIAPGIYIIIA